MQSLLPLMMIMIFIPVAASIFVLYKRIHEMPDGDRAREELLEELMMYQNKNKNKSDNNTSEAGAENKSDNNVSEAGTEKKSDNNTSEVETENKSVSDVKNDLHSDISAAEELSEEDLAVLKAKENAAAIREQIRESESVNDPEKEKRNNAAEKVMQMMKQSKKSEFSKSDLESMIAQFTNNKK